MQVVVKKSILFNLLKKSLNENRTGSSFYDTSFKGRFGEEEKEEENDFLNSDEPVRASPRASIQLYEPNFNVSDPDFTPASKSGFLSAAAAVLEHVPDNQIEFAYEQLHKLLDNTIEKEDERNYGSLKETFRRLILESSKLALDSAVAELNKNVDMQTVVQSLMSQPQFQNMSSKKVEALLTTAWTNSLIGDDDGGISGDDEMDYDNTGYQQPDYNYQSPIKTPEPQPAKARSSTKVRKRSGKSKSSPTAAPVLRKARKADLPPDLLVDDLEGNVRALYDQATNKESFMIGYNDGADDTSSDSEKRDTSSQDNDYITGYDHGYAYGDEDDFYEDTDQTSADLRREQEAEIMINREVFNDPDLPEVVKLVPEFYEIVKEIGIKLENDRYALMMAGDPEEQANQNIRQIFNISHKESFIIWNMKKSYFTYDYAMKSAKKHLKAILVNNLVRTRAAMIFKNAYTDAAAADGSSSEQAASLLLLNFVEKVLKDVSRYNYEPDKEKKRDEILLNTFAIATVYKSGPSAGPGGSEKDKAKVYQGNNTKTFLNRVKEEYREAIIADYLVILKKSYLRSVDIEDENGKIIKVDRYKIKSGGEDPNDASKLEYYLFTPEAFEDKAEAYANETIDSALAAQAAKAAKLPKDALIGAQDDDELEDDEIDDDNLGREDSPDPRTDAEISEKLSNTKDFQTLAPFFGFSGSPGMRQWFLKFAKRFFEMGIISSKSGDRTLLKFHSQMVEAVLETLSEMLPELADAMEKESESIDRKTSSFDDQDKLQIADTLRICAKQTSEAFQAFLDVGDDLTSIVVSTKNNGQIIPVPFLKTLGGQLAREVNGTFFQKVMTRLDKTWTDYVADQFQTNKQIKHRIATNISKSASIDVKAARSVAEYFIGKKNEPEVLSNRDGSDRVYKSEASGNPTKGVKTLLKYGIDADTYHILRQESRDWFEDMLMTDFAKVVDFKGQYRVMIEKDYDKLKKNMNSFKAVILKAIATIITRSEERMAMDNLSDYEVED